MNLKKLQLSILALMVFCIILISIFIYLKTTEYNIEKFEEDAESFDILISEEDGKTKVKIDTIHLKITNDETLFTTIIDKFTKGQYKSNKTLHRNIAFLLAHVNYNYKGLTQKQKNALICFFTMAIDDDDLNVRDAAEWLAVQKVYEKPLSNYYVKTLRRDKQFLWEVSTIALCAINYDNGKIFDILKKKNLRPEFFSSIRKIVKKDKGLQKQSEAFLAMIDKLEPQQNPVGVQALESSMEPVIKKIKDSARISK